MTDNTTTPQRYEYVAKNAGAHWSATQLSELVNIYAKESWELISAAGTGNATLTLFFRRPLLSKENGR